MNVGLEDLIFRRSEIQIAKSLGRIAWIRPPYPVSLLDLLRQSYTGTGIGCQVDSRQPVFPCVLGYVVEKQIWQTESIIRDF